MGSQFVHSVRNGIRGPEITYTLTGDSLNWRGDGAPRSVPLTQISKLTLNIYPADIADEEEIHGMLVINTLAGEKLTVRSHHCKGLGSYENRAATYAPFVRALSQGVAAANPRAHFATGSSFMKLLWLVLSLMIGALSALLAIVIIVTGLTWGLLSSYAIAIGAFGLAWTLFRANQKQRFNGTDPPNAFLDL